MKERKRMNQKKRTGMIWARYLRIQRWELQPLTTIRENRTMRNRQKIQVKTFLVKVFLWNRQTWLKNIFQGGKTSQKVPSLQFWLKWKEIRSKNVEGPTLSSFFFEIRFKTFFLNFEMLPCFTFATNLSSSDSFEWFSEIQRCYGSASSLLSDKNRSRYKKYALLSNKTDKRYFRYQLVIQKDHWLLEICCFKGNQSLLNKAHGSLKVSSKFTGCCFILDGVCFKSSRTCWFVAKKWR